MFLYSLLVMYKELQEKIGIHFNDTVIYQTAFTHRSYINEHRHLNRDHNERLEFLGDAVLELIVTEYLYKNYPHKSEGDMTNWRSALVRGENLAKISRDLGLGQFLYLSKGEEKSGGREKDYLLANTMEALIGAIYVEHGTKVVKQFIHDFLLLHLDFILEQGLHIDAKSKFQEISQEKEGLTPTYRLLGEEGPDHNKIFTMGLYIGEELIGSGQGSSKQSAEQSAAKVGLKEKGWE